MADGDRVRADPPDSRAWRRRLVAAAGWFTARNVHSFVGLSFSLVLLFVALTGTLSVYAPEIDWLARPALRVAPLPEGKRPLGEILDAARAAEPAWRPIALQRVPRPRFADQLTFVVPGEGQRLVWVDPYRAEVTGTGSPDTVRSVLRELHRALSSRNALAQALVAALVLPLGAVAVAGLLMHRRFWTSYFRMPRWGGSRRAVLSDLHRLLAVWLLPFLLLLVLSGAQFLSEVAGLGPSMAPMATVEPAREAPLPPGFAGADLDRAVAMAEAAMPGLRVEDVLLPRSGSEPLTLRGPAGALLVRPTASAVAVDPAAMALMTVEPAEAMGLRLRLFEAARVVHYGTMGGQATRLLWALFGAGLVALAALGAMIHAERMLKQGGIRGVPVRSRWGHYWAGMGWVGWLGALALLGGLALTARALL